MNSSQILLSICIPTYNQPEALAPLLDEIFRQATPEIEVVIRDDSNNSESENIASKYRNRGISLRYFHKEKQGLDVAIIFLTQEARGKYIWWFGDDMMADGAIKKILDVVEKNPSVSFLVLNARQTADKKGVLELGGSRFFRDRNEIIEKVGRVLGFITAVIMRKEEAVSGLKLAEKYIGSAWVCLYIVFHVLSQEGKYYFFEEPFVISQPRDPQKPTWYDGFYVFAINFYHVADEFRGKFSSRSLRIMLSENLRSILRGIFVYRAKGYLHGLGSKDPKIRPLFKLYWNFPVFWKYFPVLLIPRPVTRFFYQAYKNSKAE